MRSMTGFGTAEGPVGKGRLFVEVKSVNHRFSEFFFKIPPRMGILESLIKSKLQPLFPRGKVDIYFREKEPLFGGVSVEIDTGLARKYLNALKKLNTQLGLKSEDDDFLQIVGFDRIFRVQENEGLYEKLWKQISCVIDKAVAHVLVMQKREGGHIKRDQQRRVAQIAKYISKINKLSARALEGHIERVRRKVSNSHEATAANEQRIQQEVAFLGGRQDIAEELTRLESHLSQYKQILSSDEPVGRRLDFLLQEMNREANTIGSKAADAAISQLVVDCKAELERLREQVQNVE